MPLGHGSPDLEAQHPFMYAVHHAKSLEECQSACEQHSSMCDLVVYRPTATGGFITTGRNFSCTNTLCQTQKEKCSPSVMNMKRATTLSECAALVARERDCGAHFVFGSKNDRCECTPGGQTCKREAENLYNTYKLRGDQTPSPTTHARTCTPAPPTVPARSTGTRYMPGLVFLADQAN